MVSDAHLSRNSREIVATKAKALAPANRTITGKNGRNPSRKMYFGTPAGPTPST